MSQSHPTRMGEGSKAATGQSHSAWCWTGDIWDTACSSRTHAGRGQRPALGHPQVPAPESSLSTLCFLCFFNCREQRDDTLRERGERVERFSASSAPLHCYQVKRWAVAPRAPLRLPQRQNGRSQESCLIRSHSAPQKSG